MTKLKLALGAGHGFGTSGKRCMKALDPKETREWYLNDRIADKIEAKLRDYNVEILRVGDTNGRFDVLLQNRTSKANKWGADVYISIHHNAGINGGSGGGTVVFYYPTGDCKSVATRLYNAIVNRTGLRGNRATPIADGKHLHVIRHTTMPCFLIENGFMDSRTDVPIILSEEHAEKTAQGIVDFLIKEYSLTSSKPITEPNTNLNQGSTVLYKVQCGAFSNMINAESLRDKLKSDGYNAIIVQQ